MPHIQTLLLNLIQSQRLLLNTLEATIGSRPQGIKNIVTGLMDHMDNTGTDIFGNQDSPIQILMKRSMSFGSSHGGDEAE